MGFDSPYPLHHKENIIQIQILNVTPSNPTNKAGKPYSKLEVAYKNLTFQGKVEGKTLMGFGDTKDAHDVLILSQPGDVFEVEVKKNDKGYNDWLSATKSNGNVASARPASSNTPSSVAPSTAPRSNFETPEERAKKQVYIVRQSSISNAIALLAIGSKSRPDVKEVIDAAKQLEAYVFDEEKAREAYEAAKSSEPNLDDDIPFN